MYSQAIVPTAFADNGSFRAYHAAVTHWHLQYSEWELYPANMSLTDLESLPGWEVDQSASGVDLRVPSSGRRYLVMFAAALALFATYRSIASRHSPTSTGQMAWLGGTILFAGLALWTAFADELWHLESNYLVHRVGIGRWAFVRSYHNAELEITLRFGAKFGTPYYRLYAVVDGKPHFLFERKERELQRLTDFISSHTGWRIRPMNLG